MRPWIVWATGLLAYVIAVLDRTTLGVSGLQAADRFAASPGVLSTFVVLQVIVYAAAQVPAGLLLDRFGSRVLIVCGAALMTAGQLVLALSESLPAAIAARAVVGLGDALTFISVLRLVPYWFEPARVPLVAQLTGICGQSRSGSVRSTVPGHPHRQRLDAGLSVGRRIRTCGDRLGAGPHSKHPARLRAHT